MVTPRGQSYHPERTVSSHFPAYRPPLLAARPLTRPNLTATIAWRLTANNRASRQTHPPITAAEHKTSRPQVPHQYHRQRPAKPPRPTARTDSRPINPQKERNTHSAPAPAAGHEPDVPLQITEVSLATRPMIDDCPSSFNHTLFHHALAQGYRSPPCLVLRIAIFRNSVHGKHFYNAEKKTRAPRGARDTR
jgi:hypothetical protein